MPFKYTATLFALFLFVAGAPAQRIGVQQGSSIADASAVSAGSDLPPVAPAGRPSIGLALQGGGALGLAHVGVLEWLEDHHVPVDRIAGTSMGALVGALYASGRTPAELRSLATSDAISSVFTLQTPYTDASYRRRQDRRQIPQSIIIGLKNGFGLRNALLADGGVNAFLTRELFDYNGKALDYNRLPIPFRCVATDLNTLQPVTFAAGPLPEAVRASISIPGIFAPVKGRDGHYLVDGGILDNLPTDVLRRDLKADRVIAVRLQAATLSAGDTGSIVGVLNRAFIAGIARNMEQAEKLADVVIDVPVSNYSGTDYGNAAQLIQAGYQAAAQDRAALLRYALSDSGWQAYLAARHARRLGKPGVLRAVRVEGGVPGAEHQVQREMKPAEGRPVTAQSIAAGLKGVQSNGVYEATYETFAQPRSTSQPDEDTGILVHLTKDSAGPPYLMVAPEVAAATSNITEGELAVRFVDQSLSSFGSEFRASIRVGYLTDVTTEYYRLLAPGGYFVQPEAQVLRQPVYIWDNQARVAERFQQNLAAGLKAGRTFNNQMQIAAEWRAETTRWSLRTGVGGGPDLNGTAQTGLLRFNLDKTESSTISPNGFRLSAEAGALYHAVASDNAPQVGLSFLSTHAWREDNIFGLGAEVNSYLRARVAQPYRFTLGGPMRLSASSFDEYRGTDTYLARTGYMHRIAALPTGLGHGLYGALGYEAGEIWSPDARAILRQDGTAGLVAGTPLGVITFGVSVGDAGRRKVFFTIGRWF